MFYIAKQLNSDMLSTLPCRITILPVACFLASKLSRLAIVNQILGVLYQYYGVALYIFQLSALSDSLLLLKIAQIKSSHLAAF